jgi:uncharacterized protein
MLTVQQIKQVVTDYFKDKPVKRVYLFGSYARGEADENSDVDLLVDLDKTQKIGWAFFRWYQDLEELFTNRRVDVVANANRPEEVSDWNFLVRINQEKQLLYEKR